MNFKATTTRRKAVRILLAGTATSLLATALLGTPLFAGTATAHEGDHWPITGDSLKMKYTSDSKNSFKFKSKGQTNINAVSIAQDPTTSSSTLIVRGGGTNPGTTGVIHLDPARWKQIGSPTSPKGWKYKSDPYYSSGVSKIQLKSGKSEGSLQIQAKGTDWDFAITAPQESIEVVLTIGEFAFCAEFSTGTMASFTTDETGEVVAELALSPSDCPQVCGNGIFEVGEECDDGNNVDGDTCTNECTGCLAGDVEFASTYEGIQELIFDNPVYNCSNDACHGANFAGNGNLDLRQGSSFANLVGVTSSIEPATKRVFAGDQDLSMLYLKLAAKTLGTPVAGTPMPSGPAILTEDHLEALRLWIRGGAPETGVVAGTAELLGSCLPEPTPLDIPQPPIPDPAVGTQFSQPGYTLESGQEIEGCVATYYDVSATVPPGMQIDCPGKCVGGSTPNAQCSVSGGTCPGGGTCAQVFSGTNPTNKCFSYNGNELYQDAQSHHSIVHIYPGTSNWNDPGWGGWKCYGGPTPDAVCDPSTANVCGTDGVCGSKFHHGVACLDTLTESWGANDFQTSDAPTFSGAQESTANFGYPAGVYGYLPVRGLIVWNSHAFNLTTQDTTMEAYINITYTGLRTWPAQALFQDQWIFTQNVPPFEQREYCATHTFAEGTRLFQLSSHTHKRGIRWRYYAPPQTPCSAPGGSTSASCTPGDSGDIFYESYDYSDALTLNPDPPIHYTGSVADRTIKFCALYDNGTPAHPNLVKTQSGSPVPTGNLIVGGPCGNSEVRCMGGVNKGALCGGSDINCPGSTCDACTLRGGVTTEDEMYIATGTFYIDP